MNREFLKEAIADAKIVKETAIANAKSALEESFTPHLKNMLSTKIQEMESEEMEEIVTNEVELDDEEINLSEIESEETEEASEEAEEETSEEDVVVADMTEEDLKSFIEDVIQDSISSGEIEMETPGDEAEEMEDEEIDLDIEDDLEEACSTEETIKEEEVTENEEVAELKKELADKKSELFEAYATVKKLKNSLNEINLLNAKLLYTNKIFKAKSLTEDEKTKVVNAFDKAKTISESKIVYDTLSESLTKKKGTQMAKLQGLASKSTGVIKEQKETQILEVTDQVARWQKLAGIS